MRQSPALSATLVTGGALVVTSLVAAQVPKGEPTRAAAAPPQPAVIVRDAVKKVLAPVPARADAAVQAQAQRQQILVQTAIQQLRSHLRVEYHFIRRACELTPEQRRQIARAGERALRETAAQNVGRNLNAAQVVIVNGQARPSIPRFTDPMKPISEGLARAVERYLTPDQIARYKDEVKRRDAHWKQVGLEAILARLDSDLLLTENQRDEIMDSLSDHWDEMWAQSVTALMNLEHYFPPIPDERIVPFLDGPQKEIWNASQPNRRVVRFGIGGNRGDNGIEDEELTEAREAEDKAQTED